MFTIRTRRGQTALMTAADMSVMACRSVQSFAAGLDMLESERQDIGFARWRWQPPAPVRHELLAFRGLEPWEILP